MTTRDETTEMTFTQTEQEALERLRQHYDPDQQQFTSRELAHLQFLRCRVETGGLTTQWKGDLPPEHSQTTPSERIRV